MREGDAAFEALRAAIDELAAGEAAGLIAEARIEARAKVRSILAEAIAQSLLEHTSEALGEGDDTGGESSGPGPARGGTAQAAAAPSPARPPQDSAPSPSERPPSVTRPPAGGGTSGAAPAGPTGQDPDSSLAHRGRPEPAEPASRPAGSSTPAEPAASPPAPGPAQGALGWYVYCVIGAKRFSEATAVEGVTTGEAVVEIARGGIAVLASRVPLSEYGEERLRENLNDVRWLEETARTHEQVLEAALAQTTVIPMRLCTVYSSEDSVKEMLERERAVFSDALARLAGRTEWGVKVFVEREPLERMAIANSTELSALRAEVDALPEGEAYMKRRQLETLAAEEADLLVDACVDDVHGRLAAGVSEALLNPLQRPEVSGRAGEMLLNGVYLVEGEAADAFHATVAELGEDYSALGFTVELTGPWPPYNFVGSSIEAAR